MWFWNPGGLGFMRWKKGQAFTRNMSRSRDGKTGYLDDFISQNIVLSDSNYFYLGLGRICWLNPILLPPEPIRIQRIQFIKSQEFISSTIQVATRFLY
ncbi:MAG: hypothetical protein IPO85_00005 [Saprospiraceae bacterium]|uniref:Uncharacterized protein n=1 Tax=Candidatus Defluviibacterium haderslevense TaxID=2981993 RepID=A0A9D7S5V4_9BACT|nr:hypothetical protein [Candidatus Defluviibacterium haderslevense]